MHAFLLVVMTIVTSLKQMVKAIWHTAYVYLQITRHVCRAHLELNGEHQRSDVNFNYLFIGLYNCLTEANDTSKICKKTAGSTNSAHFYNKKECLGWPLS